MLTDRNSSVFEYLTGKSQDKEIDMWPNLYEVLLQVLVTFAQKKNKKQKKLINIEKCDV